MTTANDVYKNKLIGGMAGNLAAYWNEWSIKDSNFKDCFIPKNAKVFEVGSGNGQVCDYLISLKNSVVGSDVSGSAFLEVSKRTTTLFVDISEELVPFPDGWFDFVVCFEVLEHVTSPYHAIKEMKRICKTNGFIHISIPDYEQQVGYSSHRHAFVYPGLFVHDYFNIFLRQMYMKIVFEKKFVHRNTFTRSLDGTRQDPAQHWYYVCENTPTFKDIVEVVSGDFNESDLYNF